MSLIDEILDMYYFGFDEFEIAYELILPLDYVCEVIDEFCYL